MKILLLVFTIVGFTVSSFGQCNLGYDMDLGSQSNHSPNYLLGSAIVVSSSFNLVELGMLAVDAGDNFKVAVYDDAGGNPGNLLTEGAGTTTVGVNIIDVPDVVLAPGTYYYMAVFETNASISYTTTTSDMVWYISLPYSSTLPATFGAPLTYTGQAFSYYFISNATPGTAVVSACGSYTWIDSVTYTSSTNTPTYILQTANGCDSVVTLNLTINTVDVSVTNNDPSLLANASGATYQWLDCDSSYAQISGETNQNFTATANGNYAVLVTENGCTDTSACMPVLTIGIDELIAPEKTLVKVTDLLGRDADPVPGTPLLYIYSDGTIERKFVIE